MNAETQSEINLPFEELVTRGGDNRLDIHESGANKYNVNPVRYKEVFNRGSCTCSPFSPDGYEAALALYDRLSDEEFDRVRHEHTRKIKNLINYEDHDRFDVFYAPSGSDLCYYQLLFAKLIDPERDIFNVVTCPEELGSGSNAAFKGEYYFDRNQFGDPVPQGAPVSDLLGIDCATLPARDPKGAIVNHGQEIIDIVHERYHSHSVNVNLVIGSKSGIENNISVVSQVPETVLWTIDLCQFRASRVLINGLLGMNCSVMLTGSKFYQNPPFCAVLLVPKTVSNRFQNASAEVVSPFANIFSRYDIPDEFDNIRALLPDYRNYGLLLRWEAALQEMISLAELDAYDVNIQIEQWNTFVVDSLAGSDCFQLMPGQEVTNKTIVSFRVKSESGQRLNHEQLAELYREICGGTVNGFNGYSRVLFGQPVKYGDRSFIRMALGASDLRRFVNDGFNGDNDRRLIEIIENYVKAKYWNG